MVRNKLAVAIAAIGALQANMANALGMGDFSLNSALNQPLNAEIGLLNTDDLDSAQVLINLADSEVFASSGVSRDFFLTNLKFKVVMDGSGGGVIKITTREPVVEPYLNFLIEARWPSGKLLREYTVLLDLPVFNDSNNAAVKSSSDSVSNLQSSPASTPAAVSTAASVPVVSSANDTPSTVNANSSTVLQAGGEYRVRSDDTLWQVALKSRPAPSMTVQQTMMGIQQLNPEAFVNGNINRLKAGSVLRLPTADQISVSNRQAIGEVANQNKAWRQGDTQVTDNGPQLDATPTVADVERAVEVEARLSIASGGDSSEAASGDGQSDSATGTGTQALLDELTQAEENLDKTSRDNQELLSRLDDMESRMATLQRLLALKDDQLAALQSEASSEDSADGYTDQTSETTEGEGVYSDQADELGESADANGQDVTGSDAQAIDEDTLADSEAVLASSDDSGQVANVDEVASGAAQLQAEKTQGNTKIIDGKSNENSWLEKLKQNPLYIGAAAIISLILLAFLFLRGRKSKQEEEYQQIIDSSEFATETDPSAQGVAAAAIDSDDSVDDQYAEDESPLESDAEEGSTDLLVADLEQQIASDNAQREASLDDEESEEAAATESQTDDAIAEADIYIAYGRYHQATDLLSSSIAQEPSRSDLQVKLLEVYIETRDKLGFQQHYPNLEALNDEAAVIKIKEKLSSVDGVSNWLDDLPSDTEVDNTDLDAEVVDQQTDDLEADDELDLDLEEDLDIDLDLEDVSLDATQEMSPVDIDSPSENLGLEVGEVDEQDTVAKAEVADDGFDLDLDNEFDADLELDDLDLDAFEDSDLSDLEAEFGGDIDDTASDEALEGEPQQKDTDSVGGGFSSEVSAESSTDENDVAASLDSEEIETQVSTDSDAGLDFDLGDGAKLAGPLAADVLVGDDEAAGESDDQVELSTDGSFDQSVSEAVDDAEDFDFLADSDEVATKLDLARAYIDMGDAEGAKDILDEVKLEGTDEQKQEADSLIERID